MVYRTCYRHRGGGNVGPWKVKSNDMSMTTGWRKSVMDDVWLIKPPLECQRPDRQRKGEGRRVYGAPALPYTFNYLH